MRVLITDDMISSRMQIGIVLGALELDFEEAANGAQALEKLKQSHFDLVLMDIEMPVMNGLETARYIQDPGFVLPWPRPLVVAITAHDPEDFKESYQQLGFDGFISKPITAKKILDFLSTQSRV
ncbi:MAG: response regulator [Bacteroidales bacterium]